jgi:hypothetical protein
MRRPLAAEERAILEFMLGVDFPGARELRAQVAHAVVVARCPCGCATISIEVDRARTPAAEVCTRVPVAAENGPFGLLLFVDGGYLSGLEIYSAGDETPHVFPPPSAFRPPEARAE